MHRTNPKERRATQTDRFDHLHSKKLNTAQRRKKKEQLFQFLFEFIANTNWEKYELALTLLEERFNRIHAFLKETEEFASDGITQPGVASTINSFNRIHTRCR
jgi:hypothetical protein